MTAHTPTSAELAAFRRGIGTPNLDTEHNVAFPKYPPIHRNGVDGAWTWEIARGIGFRSNGYTTIDHGIPSSVARREANRLRSEQYAEDQVQGIVDPETFYGLLDAQYAFAPDRNTLAALHGQHGGAAGSFWPDCPLCPEVTVPPEYAWMREAAAREVVQSRGTDPLDAYELGDPKRAGL